MFSQEFLDRIRNATNLVDLVNEYTTLQRNGNWYIGRCPHPDHYDKAPSFTVKIWPNGNMTWKCFGCPENEQKQFGADCFGFIQWIHSHEGHAMMSFADSVHFLAKRAGISMEQDPFYRRYQHRYQMNKFNAITYCVKLTKEFKGYLYQRGLTDEEINKWHIGQSNQNSYGPVLTFPLLDRNKNVVGFSIRTMTGNGPKYINSRNSEIFNKSNYLYGIHDLNPSDPYLVITEGVFDVILAKKQGISNTVCTLGTAFTTEHIKLCKTLKKIPIFTFDGDKAGSNAIKSAVNLCEQEGLPCKVCRLPLDMDLADLAKQDCAKEYLAVHTIAPWAYKLSLIAAEYHKELREQKKLRDKISKTLNIKMSNTLIRLRAQQRLLPDIKRIKEIIPKEDEPYFKAYLEQKFRGVYNDLYPVQ